MLDAGRHPGAVSLRRTVDGGGHATACRGAEPAERLVRAATTAARARCRATGGAARSATTSAATKATPAPRAVAARRASSVSWAEGPSSATAQASVSKSLSLLLIAPMGERYDGTS